MNNEELIRKIQDLFTAFLAQRGFELIDLTYRFENGRNILRLLVDRPAGGITLDECAGLNRELGQMLEETNLIPEHYYLELNSPGLDRPLTQERDFARNMGKEIKVFLREAINGRIEVDGTISALSAGELTLLTKDGCFVAPFDKIHKAKLII